MERANAMTMTPHRIRRGQEGQAMVEFALVIPLLLLLIFGIIQFGILFNNYLTLTDAVRVGARQAAVSRTLATPVATTTDRVKGAAAGLDKSKLEISVDAYNPADGSATWAQGGDVTVTAKYPFHINLFGFVVMSGKLTSKTTERLE
jgi:Flp pilus assembly protein TadG